MNETTDWKTKITLLMQRAQKILILGIGNELMADDGAGSRIAGELTRLLGRRKTPKPLRIIDAGTAPENFTGVIKKERPDLILMIDSVDSGERPGVIAFRDLNEMRSPMHSTHTLPLSSLAQYLEQSTRASVIVLGIQPGVVHFGLPLSDEVSSSIREVAHSITEALGAASLGDR